MSKLYRIDELPKDIRISIYNTYLENSNMTEKDISIKGFINYSAHCLGNVYTLDGRFIDELSDEEYLNIEH